MHALCTFKHDVMMTSLQLEGVNQLLVGAVDELSSRAASTKVRLQRLADWWTEYLCNRGNLLPWLQEAEEMLSQLLARSSSEQPPRESPLELLEDARVRIM